jgi:hypothetical protein
LVHRIEVFPRHTLNAVKARWYGKLRKVEMRMATVDMDAALACRAGIRQVQDLAHRAEENQEDLNYDLEIIMPAGPFSSAAAGARLEDWTW